MAILKPGQKFRLSKILSKRKSGREIVALLSLTAMVDMFTVLVIFLLQNYNVTGQVINIPENVKLPEASSVKELKPSHVVTVSNTEILLEDKFIISYGQVVNQEDWMIRPLYEAVVRAMRNQEEKMRTLGVKADANTPPSAPGGKTADDPDRWKKVTVQADQDIDFLTVKKVMYTITEAGVAEINFAVLSEKTEPKN